jgi:hypothetical protein
VVGRADVHQELWVPAEELDEFNAHLTSKITVEAAYYGEGFAGEIDPDTDLPLRTSKDLVILVVTLLAHGCPIQAIVVAFGLDERTVVDWQERSGQHCEKVHEHLVERPRDLGQRPEGTRGDEIRVKVQGDVVWMAMALQVRVPFGCRLWLGGVLSAYRDTALITALMQKVRACALCRPLLFCMDGCQAYIQAIRSVFREPIRTGKAGKPRLRPWDGVLMAKLASNTLAREW